MLVWAQDHLDEKLAFPVRAPGPPPRARRGAAQGLRAPASWAGRQACLPHAGVCGCCRACVPMNVPAQARGRLPALLPRHARGCLARLECAAYMMAPLLCYTGIEWSDRVCYWGDVHCSRLRALCVRQFRPRGAAQIRRSPCRSPSEHAPSPGTEVCLAAARSGSTTW